MASKWAEKKAQEIYELTFHDSKWFDLGIGLLGLVYLIPPYKVSDVGKRDWVHRLPR